MRAATASPRRRRQPVAPSVSAGAAREALRDLSLRACITRAQGLFPHNALVREFGRQLLLDVFAEGAAEAREALSTRGTDASGSRPGTRGPPVDERIGTAVTLDVPLDWPPTRVWAEALAARSTFPERPVSRAASALGGLRPAAMLLRTGTAPALGAHAWRGDTDADADADGDGP